MVKFHYKWVDKKSETTQERSLITTNLTMSESTGLFALPGRQTLVSAGNWNLSLNLLKVSIFREHSFLRVCNARGVARKKGREDEGMEEGTGVAMSVSALDDKPVSKSLDLTLDPILSPLKTSRTDLNQAKDWRNNGYKLPNIKLTPLSPRTKSPIRGRWL